ncbi:MAG TPA: HrpF/NolX family T3SS translocon protein, partial [Paraburkholderia sp.]|nr:HrpF/NolX family T3SS translocon protein [Paraburkholderia sp.]
APTYSTQAPASAEDAGAVAAMQDGEADQPDTKAKKGGQFQDIVHAFLTIASKIESVVSKVLGVIADLKIPLLSQLAAAGSVGARAISSGYKLVDTALEGGDMKQAGIKAAFDVGGAALGALTVPGAGTALKGAESAALGAAYQANKGVINRTAAKEAGKEIAKDGAKEVAGTEYDAHKDDLQLPGVA